MSFKRFLEDIVPGRAPGPRPSFSVFDLIRVLELVGEEESVGRGKIAQRTELGEGTTRTVINRLTQADIVAVSKDGCTLTARGRRIWNELGKIMPRKVELRNGELAFANHNVAILVKGRSEKVRKGLEQRDAAVMAGAKGAVTLIFRDKRLILPTVSADLAKDFAKASNSIRRLMNLEENDVVIISSADCLKEAEYGALAAAWSLI